MADQTAAQILKQVQFYFSDSNLPKDDFLYRLYEKDNGWIEIKTIASFKRMQQLSKDLDVVTAALRTDDSFLEVSEDGTKVRRRTPLPQVEAIDADIDARSIYAKGFDGNISLEDLNTYFAKYGTVKCVRMRRFKDRKFKGSVFVEFATPEEAKAVVAMELVPPPATAAAAPAATEPAAESAAAADAKPAAAAAAGGKKPLSEPVARLDKLQLEMKGDYQTRKMAEHGIAPGRGGASARARGRGRARGAVAATGAASGKRKTAEGSEEAGDDAAAAAPEVLSRDYEKDQLVYFGGLPDGVLREDLKEFLEAAGCKVRYVDFSRGQTDGTVRLQEGSDPKASAAVAKLSEEKKELKGTVPTLRALQGDEEKAYWDGIFDRQEKSKAAGSAPSGRGDRGKRGGRGGRGGGRGGNKRAKTDAKE